VTGEKEEKKPARWSGRQTKSGRHQAQKARLLTAEDMASGWKDIGTRALGQIHRRPGHGLCLDMDRARMSQAGAPTCKLTANKVLVLAPSRIPSGSAVPAHESLFGLIEALIELVSLGRDTEALFIFIMSWLVATVSDVGTTRNQFIRMRGDTLVPPHRAKAAGRSAHARQPRPV